MKLIKATPMVVVLLLAGCATQPSYNDQIAAAYRQATRVFKACLASTSFKESPVCYKEQLDIIDQLPPHSGQAAFRRHNAKMYQTQLNWVSGHIDDKQVNAITQLSLAELRVDLERQNSIERMQSMQQRANVSKALSDLSNATSQPPSIRCRSSRNPSGGFDSVCQ
jgi:predicted negative regulator of RcsB-dependent stress response